MKRALAFILVVGQVLLLIALLTVPHGTVWTVNGFVIATSVTLVVGGVALAVRGSTTLGPSLTPSPVSPTTGPAAAMHRGGPRARSHLGWRGVEG